MKDNPRLDPLIFINEDLIRNIEALNLYSIQGSQSCGLFSLAAVKLITSKDYTFEEIQDLLEDGIFQLMVCKIVIDGFLGDKNQAIKIKENMDKEYYNIYINKKNKIGIKKDIKKFTTKSIDGKICLSLNKERIVDDKMVERLLIDKGYSLI